MGEERAMVERLEERRMMSVSALSLASIPDGTSNITDGTSNTIFVGVASGGIWKTTNFLTTDATGPRF
jgi:hypothetical protein